MNSSFAETDNDFIFRRRDRKTSYRGTSMMGSALRNTKNLLLFIFLVAIFCLLWVPKDNLRRMANENRKNNSTMSFRLPVSAEDWCAVPKLPPFDYSQCKDKVSINKLPLYGGLTNSLKIMLLGAVLSFEEDRCFVVDESTSALPKRESPEDSFNTSFYNRYFSPVGLPSHTLASTNLTVQTRGWEETWGNWSHNRRIKSQLNTIDSLGLKSIDGHSLKRYVMKRLWRPLPWLRKSACAKLENQLGRHAQRRGRTSEDEFIAFSVRRGDKASENFTFASLDQYIIAAEKAAVTHFHGGRNETDIYSNPKKMPTIFVATDDCTVMGDFRSRRPHWNFVSECDDNTNHQSNNGFRINDMKRWDSEATDAHFRKFMVELIAMASAKYFIGVLYTNVTWWVLFMRSQDPSTFKILTTPGTKNREGIDYW